MVGGVCRACVEDGQAQQAGRSGRLDQEVQGAESVATADFVRKGQNATGPQRWVRSEIEEQRVESASGQHFRQGQNARTAHEGQADFLWEDRQSSDDESHSSRCREQDEELLAAQTQAAMQASLQERPDAELPTAISRSKYDHEVRGAELLLRIAKNSVDDTEDQALHEAKIDSLRTYIENLSRRDERAVDSLQVTGRARRPSNTAYVPQPGAGAGSHISSSVVGTMEPRSPRNAVRERWFGTQQPRDLHPSTPAVHPHHYARQEGQHQPGPHRPRTGPTAGLDWSQPPAICRSPSPTIMIRTAAARRAQQERQRSDLYNRHPAGPVSENQARKLGGRATLGHLLRRKGWPAVDVMSRDIDEEKRRGAKRELVQCARGAICIHARVI